LVGEETNIVVMKPDMAAIALVYRAACVACYLERIPMFSWVIVRGTECTNLAITDCDSNNSHEKRRLGDRKRVEKCNVLLSVTCKLSVETMFGSPRQNNRNQGRAHHRANTCWRCYPAHFAAHNNRTPLNSKKDEDVRIMSS
jgi:hypothetical protein